MNSGNTPPPDPKKLTLIGGGNLGKSILSGLTKSDLFQKKHITVVGKTKQNLAIVAQEFGVTTTQHVCQAIRAVRWVILCVPPRQLQSVLDEIQSEVTADHVLISTVAGVSIADIQNSLPHGKVIRVMPNTAAGKRLSMTCIAATQNASDVLDFVTQIFETIGKTLVIEERLMQAATVLGASGIAFFLRFLRAMTQGGIQMGFHPNEAQIIAVQTAIGAANLLLDEDIHPESEIDKVTTPQGCTIEGLNEMEHQGLSSSIIKGVMASYEKINTIK